MYLKSKFALSVALAYQQCDCHLNRSRQPVIQQLVLALIPTFIYYDIHINTQLI